MTNSSIFLTTQLQSALLDAQVKRAKERGEPLSFLGIKFVENDSTKSNYKEILSFINNFLSASSAIVTNDGVFVFILPQTKLHTAVMQSKNLTISLKMQYKVELEAVSLTALESDDDSDAILNRVKFYIDESQKQDAKVCYGTSDFSYSDSKESLKSLFTTMPEIYGYGFYKEAPLMQQGEVTEYGNGLFEVKFHREFLEFLKKEESIYLEHPSVPDIMQCDIISVELSHGVVSLADIKFIDDSPVHRKNIRVTPHKPIKAHIKAGMDFEADGIVYDISKESLLITLQLPKIAELNAKELGNRRFDISFGMELDTNNTVMVSTKAMIFKIIGNQIVFSIYPSSEVESEIVSYIQKCQQLLLLEAKGLRV